MWNRRVGGIRDAEDEQNEIGSVHEGKKITEGNLKDWKRECKARVDVVVQEGNG